MTPPAPPRPQWVEDLNALGAGVGGPEDLVGLDAAELVETAVARCGLDDFGDEGWREPYELLLADVDEHAQLHLVGRILTRQDVLRSLVNRLRIAETLRTCPEIGDEVVRSPVFVTGMGRSGTTVLHELLALDPSNRAPATWELLYPCPPPEPETRASDARIALARADWELWDKVAPEYATMHENRADAPNECILGTMPTFQSDTWSGAHHAPRYGAWLAASEMTYAYEFHRTLLQLLQSRHETKRWVLKAPSHLQSLPSLFRVYPDATVVVTHRDPLEVLPSLVSLMATLVHMRSDLWRHRELADLMTAAMPVLLDHVDLMRASSEVPDAQIVDVRYRDLVDDPLLTMRDLYARLDRPFTPEHRDRIAAHLARPRTAPHDYRVTDLGVDAVELRGRFSAYMNRHGLTTDL